MAVWPWLAAIGSGVLLARCFPPWNQGGLVWFGLAPLICAVWFGGKRPWLLGYVAGLVYFTTAFQWLSALGELFQAPALRGLPVLLSAYLALYPAAWAWFLARILVPSADARRFPNSWRNLGIGVLAASAWTGLEWMRGWFLSGFSWDGLGVALHQDLPMIQIAEWVGTIGLTWLITFINVMGVIIVRRILGEIGAGFMRRVRWEFSITLAVLVGVFSYGLRQLWSGTPAGTTIMVAAVQPNIPQTDKFDRDEDDRTQQKLENLTLAASALNPGLILWPEASTARGLFADEDTLERFERMRAQVPIPLLIGTVEDTLEDAVPRSYNAAMLLPPGPAPLQEQPPTYRKMHLVPFGEYLPLRPLLNPIAGGLVPGDIAAGRDFVVFQPGTDRAFATLICFEDTLGGITRQFVRKGANLLVNITNDGWFLHTAGSEQHLANAVLRAVENRRPLVRCGNSGITALVQANGSVDRWIQPHTEGFAVKAVEFPKAKTPLTFYTRYGDWVGWMSALATLAFCGWRRGARN